MFIKGETIKMTPSLVGWCKKTLDAGGVDMLKLWVSWATQAPQTPAS